MRWLTFIHKKSQQPAIAAVAALLLLISGRVPDGFYTLCITKLKLNSGNMSPSSPFALFSLHLSLGARGAELISGNCVSRFIPLPPEPLFYSKLYTHTRAHCGSCAEENGKICIMRTQTRIWFQNSCKKQKGSVLN